MWLLLPYPVCENTFHLNRARDISRGIGSGSGTGSVVRGAACLQDVRGERASEEQYRTMYRSLFDLATTIRVTTDDSTL